MTKRKREQLKRAIERWGELSFECGEWDRNESDVPYETLFARERAAKEKVDRLVKEIP